VRETNFPSMMISHWGIHASDQKLFINPLKKLKEASRCTRLACERRKT